ncbi:MAG: alpha/beta hydrolase [Flavobacteriaceae bacterium]|nr:alpha/beta hydrolase [Flavobacteriaceae bacterium]
MKPFKYKENLIYYQVEGEGEPLLLIHGFLENSTMWKDFTEKWKKSKLVISLDLPGHGNTPPQAYLHSMDLYAQICIALLLHLGVEKANVVGHSMGGYVGMELLHQNPKLIEQLVLLNSTALPDSEARKTERSRAIQAIQKYPDAFVQMAVKNLFLMEDQERLEIAINHAITEAKKCSQQGIIATLEGLKSRKNHTATLANTKVSTTLVAGKKDQVVAFEATKQLAKETKTRLVSLPGGHMSHLEFPETTFQVISNLIQNQ